MHGRTPVALLNDVGALGARSCAVHATHLTDADVELLGGSRTAICMCPTTERDLADGIGPARALGDRGSPLCVGSDSHAVVDVLEEARAVELDQRLASEVRGHWRATELLHAATAAGHEALGWHGGGRLQAGAPADLVTVRRDSVRLAGSEPASLLESIVFAASAPDVRDVIVGGRPVVAEGRHLQVDDVPEALCSTIKAVLA
jgi:formiminoglutamate deiminase